MRSCESWSMRKGGQRVRTHGRNVTCSTVLHLCEVTCSCESNVLFLWHVLNVKLCLVLEQSESSCQHTMQFYFKNERSWMKTLHFQQIYSICLGSAVPVGHCPVLFDSFLTRHLISSLNMSRETWMASEAIKPCAAWRNVPRAHCAQASAAAALCLTWHGTLSYDTEVHSKDRGLLVRLIIDLGCNSGHLVVCGCLTCEESQKKTRFWRSQLPKAPFCHTEEKTCLGHTGLVLVSCHTGQACHEGESWRPSSPWGCCRVPSPQSGLKSAFGPAGVCGGTQQGDQGWVQAMHKHAQQKREEGGFDSHLWSDSCLLYVHLTFLPLLKKNHKNLQIQLLMILDNYFIVIIANPVKGDLQQLLN